jgi:hypothetical protein
LTCEPEGLLACDLHCSIVSQGYVEGRAAHLVINCLLATTTIAGTWGAVVTCGAATAQTCKGVHKVKEPR